MILCQNNLNRLTTKKYQEEEIERLQKAGDREVLYTISTGQNSDIIDTLLHMAKVQYHNGVKDYTARYIKTC